MIIEAIKLGNLDIVRKLIEKGEKTCHLKMMECRYKSTSTTLL